MLSGALRELLLVARGILRRPAVPMLLVLVVAAGVTFLTTAYGVFDALLWRPLPYGAPSRYAMLGEARRGAFPPVPRSGVDLVAAYFDAQAHGRMPAVEALIPLEERRVNLEVDGVASAETATWLLVGTMHHLQVAPLIGRYPADPDGAARVAREIAVGEGLWARSFARSREVIGRRVMVDGEAAVVVGVMPATFQFHRMSELWVAWSSEELFADPSRSVPLVARLSANGTFDDLGSQMDPPLRMTLRSRTPPDTLRMGHRMRGPFGRDLVPEPLARLIMSMMALVLVAACLNLATLFLARTSARAPDYATRAALGAGRAGVLRHLLGEVALVVVAGGALALLASWWLLAWIRHTMAGVLPLWVELRLDGRCFGVALAALALALTLVALPAIRLTRRLDLAQVLAHKGVLGRAPRHGRGFSALIATQVALVVILAAATAPIAVSARNLAAVQSGVDDDRVVQVEVHLAGTRYADGAARGDYFEAVRRRLEADPRVEGVARVGARDWADAAVPWSDSVYTDASPEPLPWLATRMLSDRVVSDGYFDVVGLERIAGAGFPAGLGEDGEAVAVLSAAVARLFWPDAPAIGRRFRRGTVGPWTRVVGVVEDEVGIYEDWGGTTAQPHLYVYRSDRQIPAQGMTFLVRAGRMTSDLPRDLRQVVEQVDATQSVTEIRTRAEIFAQPRLERKWLAIVLGSGAVVTVLLAMTGVFGLVSYYTTARLPELALRVALGAPTRTVVWLVTRGTLRSLSIGVLVGALFLSWVQRFVERFAFATSAFDPMVLGVVVLLVLTVAAMAVTVPLRRVQRLAPQELLRPE
ncbi:MAG: ABC transporter permease [Gemmatimonadaceae bacterium]